MRRYRYEIQVPGQDGTAVVEHGMQQHGDAHGLGRLVLAIWKERNSPQDPAGKALVRVWGEQGVFVELDDTAQPAPMTAILEHYLEEKMIADFKLRRQMRVVHGDGLLDTGEMVHRTRHALQAQDVEAVLDPAAAPESWPWAAVPSPTETEVDA